MNIPKYIIPTLALVTLLSGYFLRLSFTQPTTTVGSVSKGDMKVVCVVDGVKCKGTANFFTRLYDDVEGISSIETFGSEHKAIITYDESTISKDRIREIMEQPIPLRDGSQRQVFKCVSMK